MNEKELDKFIFKVNLSYPQAVVLNYIYGRKYLPKSRVIEIFKLLTTTEMNPYYFTFVLGEDYIEYFCSKLDELLKATKSFDSKTENVVRKVCMFFLLTPQMKITAEKEILEYLESK
jgi:hypothetical protein